MRSIEGILGRGLAAVAFLLLVGADLCRGESLEVVSLLKAGEYAAIEKEFSHLLASREKDETGTARLYAFYESVCTKPPNFGPTLDWIALLSRWAESRPDSHFAHACLGMALGDLGQEVRGTGWANSVSPEAFREVREHLANAITSLERAYELDPTDPFLPAQIIREMLNFPEQRDAMEAWFKRGVAADPRELQPYTAKLVYLMPKWHGSREEMFAFAREVASEAEAGTLLPLLLTTAHWETYNEERRQKRKYFPDPAAWSEMRTAYQQVLASFPRAVLYRNYFAKAAYLNDDYPVAMTELTQIGEAWDSSCWGSADYFNKVKAFVASKVPRPQSR